MTDKEIGIAERWCINHLGYIPTEEEWIALGKEEPGLQRLFLHVINKPFADRKTKEEQYSYSKKPSTKELIEDKDKRNLWKKEKRNKDANKI